jgi:transposase
LITLGIDPHKDAHTAAAVDDTTGQLLDELTVAGTTAGHERLLAWAHGLAGEDGPRFALEDCRHVNGRLERFLLAAGEPVIRVGTRMTRGSGRAPARSASRTRSTLSRSPVPPCASRVFRPRPTTLSCAS